MKEMILLIHHLAHATHKDKRMTDEAYTGVTLHEDTIVLEADGIPGQIVL